MAELPGKVFTDKVLITEGISHAARYGYAFVPGGMSEETLERLQAEADGLHMELGDHISKPIYEGTKKQITQMHERSYHEIGGIEVPVATFVTTALAVQARRLRHRYPELQAWMPTEAGYQRYADTNHHISKHRDRRTDQLLAATITITGRATVGIHESLGDPDDYTNTQLVDQCVTAPGTIMFLRAQGLAAGEQVIHDVSPPHDEPRLILNLRMRPDILPGPSEITSK